MMDRLFFHSTALTIFRPIEGIPGVTGTPPNAHSTIDYLKRTMSTTGNKGNMVHAEAVLKLFTTNQARSVVGNLANLQKAIGDDFTAYLDQRFDGVVLSLANFIRRGQNHTSLVEALTATQVPIYVFGAGMQDPLPPKLDAPLTESTQALIRLLGEKAKLFAVRGETTASWLKSVGVENTVVLGCPSMYVYPRSILSVKPPASLQGELRVLTAGHVSESNIDGSRKGFTRGKDIVEVMEGFNADYVFQDEPFQFYDLVSRELMYDDALGKFDSETMNRYILDKTGIKLPFKDYFWFHDVASWRQFTRHYDVYVGDRFHGGVVCLQAGVPVMMIATDQRMQELAGYFGIPHTDFDTLKQRGLRDVTAEKMSPEAMQNFRATYLTRLANFKSVMDKFGFNLANAAQINAALASSAA